MIKKIKNFVLLSIQEVKSKVAWPTYSALQSNSILVLVASLIFAIVVGFMDLSFKNIISWFYSIF